MDFNLDRRRFLAMGAAAGAIVAAESLAPGLALAKGKNKPLTLEECQAMTPLKMAENSPYVMASWKYILKITGEIHNPKLRAMTRQVLDNPCPTLLERLGDAAARKRACEELTAGGYVKDATPDTLLPAWNDPHKAPQPFYSAPGSGYQSHHAYPGGLATHTAGNLHISVEIFKTYQDVYGLTMDRDTIIAAQALHDLHKPWVFQWQASGESRTEKVLAGQGEHHVLGVAESMVRGFSPEVVVAQACAHDHPGTPKDEAEVVSWIKAAAILAGKDPAASGYLAKDGKTLPLPRRMEGFVTHLGDHDYVLTVPAAKWTIAALGELAKSRYAMTDADLKGAKFNALRNAVFSKATIMNLYGVYSTAGQKGLADAVERLVKPA